MKYLPLYYKWMEKGRLPYDGLCHSITDHKYLDLFDDGRGGYWAYYTEYYDHPIYTQDIKDAVLRRELCYAFNPLRQNIVLFLAAMNNEL